VNVCVFCGSNPGLRPEYAKAAHALGAAVAARGWGVVYGGARVGLMGIVADGALDAGGTVVGVLPEGLVQRELAHQRLTELVIVGSMHERKAEMARRADAFVVLPGGLGTLEETFEVLTWAQLGIHDKPTGLLDVAGYFTGLLDFLDHAVAERLVRPEHRDMILVGSSPEALLDEVEAYEPPSVRKWLDMDQT
jgi:uncharacterized protein (TIGR00730 family)